MANTVRYSPIKRVAIKNFKNLGGVQIDFDNSPIIALKGNNDSGKSSIIDAVAVCAYNAYETHQKEFIKLGTIGFGVVIELEDGTKVTRIKKSDLNWYEVVHPDGTTWNTDKLIRGEGLPTEVEKVIGCIRENETKEFLHIRTYNDTMLFINSQNSTNYKVMYDALKVDNLTRAIKKGSVEANEIRAWINDASVKKNTLLHTLNGIQIIDLEPLTSCRDRLASNVERVKVLGKIQTTIQNIEKSKQSLGNYAEFVESGIDVIDTGRIRLLDSINRQVQNIDSLNAKKQNYSDVEKLTVINIPLLNKISSAMSDKSKLDVITGERAKYSGVENISTVSTSIFNILVRVFANVKQLDAQRSRAIQRKSDMSELKEINSTLIEKIAKAESLLTNVETLRERKSKSDAEYNSAVEQLKSLGYSVITCKNCGNNILIDSNGSEVGEHIHG